MFTLVHLNSQYVISASRGHLQIHNIQFDMGLDLTESRRSTGPSLTKLFSSNIKPKVCCDFSYTFFKVKFKHFSSTLNLQNFPAPYRWSKILIYIYILMVIFIFSFFITIMYIVLCCKHLKLCFIIAKTLKLKLKENTKFYPKKGKPHAALQVH